MTWRNPFPRFGRHLHVPKNMTPVEYAVVFAHMAWRMFGSYTSVAARIRAGARHACARLRRERDEARERAWELEELLRQSENHAAEEYARGYLAAGWRIR